MATKRSDGRWLEKIHLGNGNYKYIYGKTQKEAILKAEAVRNQVLKNIDVHAAEQGFGYWAEKWLDYKEPQVGDSQYKSRNSCLNHYKETDIWNTPIEKLKTIDFQQVIDSLAIYNPTTHRPTARSTLLDIKRVASSVYKYAIMNRVTDYNPAEFVVIPKKAPEGKRRALTDEEIEWIRDMDYCPAQLYAMIMLYAGLRRGELMALTWSDIRNGNIYINKAGEFINTHLQIKSPKTEAGNRVIPIPDVLKDYLATVKKDSPLVCHNPEGNYYTPSGWASMWNGFLLELDILHGKRPKKKSKYDGTNGGITIQPFTAHCLRHTYASLLYKAGVDILTAKDLLGHSDIKTTLGIYTHLDAKYKEKNISKFNDYLLTKYA